MSEGTPTPGSGALWMVRLVLDALISEGSVKRVTRGHGLEPAYRTATAAERERWARRFANTPPIEPAWATASWAANLIEVIRV